MSARTVNAMHCMGLNPRTFYLFNFMPAIILLQK